MTRHLHSIGAIATQFQLRAGIVLNTAESQGIEPELTLDGVPYFAEADVARLHEFLRPAINAKK